MMHSLSGTDLSVYDYTPIRGSDTDVALTGFLDMPARIGETGFEWAGEDGIEPYVSADDIQLGGRDLTLTGVITGADHYDCMNKVNSLYALIDTFTNLVPFVHPLGSHSVYVNKAITGDYLGNTGTGGVGVKVIIPMREPVVPITETLPTGNSSEFGIDGISFAQLGGAYLELGGDRRNRTAPKSFSVTGYGKETYAITKRSTPSLDFGLGIKTSTYAEMKTKVYGLMKLLSAPGMRYLTVNNDKIRSVFAKDGFTVSKIHAYSEECFCVIDCQLTESGRAGTLTDLITELGDLITYQGNNIQVRI